jgi:Spy/CpxP family protein refolding chaperone
MRRKILMNAAIILGLVVFAGWAVPQTGNQAAVPSAQASVTADQQKQLDQLRQLEDQLSKDRTAVHEAVGKFGFDSDQVDAAREQLVRDRTEYRQMRRSLVAAGVAVPRATGMGLGRSMAGQGRMGPRGRMMRGGGRCQCPCFGR